MTLRTKKQDGIGIVMEVSRGLPAKLSGVRNDRRTAVEAADVGAAAFPKEP